MRLASLRHDGRLRPALLHSGHGYLLEDAFSHVFGGFPARTDAGASGLLGIGGSFEMQLAEVAGGIADVVKRFDLTPYAFDALGPPLPRPGKIICVGRNYAEHARELKNELPERPILFAKFATAVVGPFDDIVRPREVQDLDYEAELCVVIGAGGRRISRERALAHVAGYCCANDVSARTAQLKSGDQWLRGKSFDSFCPLGPAIVTRDEIFDPQSLRIQCRVDGEVRQDDTTASMLFDVATLISYCSDAFTLETGDIILTGTPSGVAMGREPPPWLQPGQLCEVEIDGVGRLANRIVDEAKLVGR